MGRVRVWYSVIAGKDSVRAIQGLIFNIFDLLGLKASRNLQKNDDTLLEFRRMWRFLTGAGVHDHVLICSFDDNKFKFQV